MGEEISLGSVRTANTTAEVVELLGPPQRASSDGRYSLYSLDAEVAWHALGEGRDQEGPSNRSTRVLILFEFDPDQNTARRVSHECDDRGDLICSASLESAMQELTLELEALARSNDSTLTPSARRR